MRMLQGIFIHTYLIGSVDQGHHQRAQQYKEREPRHGRPHQVAVRLLELAELLDDAADLSDRE